MFFFVLKYAHKVLVKAGGQLEGVFYHESLQL